MRDNAILLASALDGWLGEPRRWHPVSLMGIYLRGVRRLPRTRSPAGDRRNGAFAMFAGCFAFAAAGRALERAAQRLPASVSPVVSALVLKPTFAVRALLDAGAGVHVALQSGEVECARALLGRHLVSRDTANLSASEVAGAAIESLAENLTDSVVAPLLAAAAGGAGAAYAYRFLNTADAVLGYRTPELIELGRAPALWDDAANWLPARAAALLIAAAAPVAGGSGMAALRSAFREHGTTDSPNAGWTMAAMAGALGVRLTKRGEYTLNDAARAPGAEDLEHAIMVVAAAAGLATAIAAGLARMSTSSSPRSRRVFSRRRFAPGSRPAWLVNCLR